MPVRTKVPLWLQGIALLVGPIAISGGEAWEWLRLTPEQRQADLLPFLVATVPYLAWLVVLPLLLPLRQQPDDRGHPWNKSNGTAGILFCFLVSFLFGAGTTAFMGWRVRGLPPLYHDEYSYLFQSWTFLGGRLWLPSHALAPYFDQMHVLNDGVFAGRYFPGSSLYYAPFVALGIPVAGAWLAQGLVAGFVAMTAYRSSPAAGYLAGGMVATSPALLAFSNLLLSPHPTMLGFAIFLWAYPRVEGRSAFWPCLAGLAIGFAFLCRPLTAVGLGLPFAVHATWRAWMGWRGGSEEVANWPKSRSLLPTRSQPKNEMEKTRENVVTPSAGETNAFDATEKRRLPHNEGKPAVLGEAEKFRISPRGYGMLVGCFGIALVILLAYNAAITGSPWQSPYGRYLAKHTPSHTYGFYNRARGLASRGPETLIAYDDWAENLTPSRALELTKERWERLLSWGIGVVPTLTLGVLALSLAMTGRMDATLPMFSVAGLTAAFFPYAFPGILGFSYLVELLPPLFLAFGVAVDSIAKDWRSRGWPWIGAWWLAFPLIAMVTNLLVSDPLLFEPDSELVYPRLRAAERRRLEETACLAGPILVLVDANPRDAVHSTHVHNHPALDGPVVRAWFQPIPGRRRDLPGYETLMAHFPERSVYLYRPSKGNEPAVWTRLRGAIKSR